MGVIKDVALGHLVDNVDYFVFAHVRVIAYLESGFGEP